MKTLIFIASFVGLCFAQTRLVHTQQDCSEQFYKEITEKAYVYAWTDIDSVKHTWNYHAARFGDDDVTLVWYVENGGKLSYMEKVINRFSILRYE